MSLQACQEMLANFRDKYQSGDWRLKHKILNGFVAATGYDRKHAIKLLNSQQTTNYYRMLGGIIGALRCGLLIAYFYFFHCESPAFTLRENSTFGHL